MADALAALWGDPAGRGLLAGLAAATYSWAMLAWVLAGCTSRADQ